MIVKPLPGPGLVARSGDLTLVCADSAAAGDLLTLVTDVAGSGGDGSALVRRLAALLATDTAGRYPACAATGPAPDGRFAVLVHGTATATVARPDGTTLISAVDAVTSVNRLVAGPVLGLRLELPGAGVPNPLARLDAGVVAAGGVTWGEVEPGPTAPGEADPAGPLAAGHPAGPLVGGHPAGPFAAVPLLPGDGLVAVEPPDPPEPDRRPLVLGRPCVGAGHLNPGQASACAICGSSLSEVEEVGPRPPLGVLRFDDGSLFRLDGDYLLGRDPHHDGDVLAGHARALPVTDPTGVVGRRHLKIQLAGWDVLGTDLSSTNGTTVRLAGAPLDQRLAPLVPVVLPPGSRVTMGRRWFTVEADRG